MKVVAAVFADFSETLTGRASCLTEILGSRTILAHMLARAARIRAIDTRLLVVRQRDQDAAADALAQSGLDNEFELLAIDSGARPRRELIAAARKWSLSAWRGGLLGTTWFDEYVEPLEAGRILDRSAAEAVLCLDGSQPALDPDLADRMIAHLQEHEAAARYVFAQAPPGLAGVLLRRQTVRDLLESGQPLGLSLSYRPEQPRLDPITSDNCCRVARTIVETGLRLTGDTIRSREILAAAFADLGEDASAEALCGYLVERNVSPAGMLPLEVELELTTQYPLPQTTLLPRGDCVRQRSVSDLGVIEKLFSQLGAYDDRMVVLGGHGDPLAHPLLAEVCHLARDAGICGIAVVTPLVELSDAAFEALFDAKVDVVEVRLDAATADTYARVHGADRFERVLANIARIESERTTSNRPRPLIVPSITRCRATLDEIESFYDQWITRVGSAVIRGYNDYCGVLEQDACPPLTPPIREPCRRLGRRLMLLADGRVAQCAQDINGDAALGDWTRATLREIWSGVEREHLVRDHAKLDLRERPLCKRCGQWHIA